MKKRRTVDIANPSLLVDQIDTQDMRYRPEVAAVRVVVTYYRLAVVLQDRLQRRLRLRRTASRKLEWPPPVRGEPSSRPALIPQEITNVGLSCVSRH